jgi:hypothetical protein
LWRGGARYVFSKYLAQFIRITWETMELLLPISIAASQAGGTSNPGTGNNTIKVG